MFVGEEPKGLNPLSGVGLKPFKYNTKNGVIEIKEDGWVWMETGKNKRVIRISPDGMKVKWVNVYNVVGGGEEDDDVVGGEDV